jgi:hypothetical protein
MLEEVPLSCSSTNQPVIFLLEDVTLSFTSSSMMFTEELIQEQLIELRHTNLLRLIFSFACNCDIYISYIVALESDTT